MCRCRWFEPNIWWWLCKQTGTARQILSNVTRRSSAVRAGKHLTLSRCRLWELNPRLLQLQSIYWPSSKKKKKNLHTTGATMAARLFRSSKRKVMVKTSIILSCLGILYIYACVSVCGWECDVLTPLSRRCESAALPTGDVKMSHWLCPAYWDECRVTKVNNNHEKWKTLLLLLLIFGLKMFPDYWLIILKAFPLRGPRIEIEFGCI